MRKAAIYFNSEYWGTVGVHELPKILAGIRKQGYKVSISGIAGSLNQRVDANR